VAPVELLLVISSERIDHGDNRRLGSSTDKIKVQHALKKIISHQIKLFSDGVNFFTCTARVCIPHTIALVFLLNMVLAESTVSFPAMAAAAAAAAAATPEVAAAIPPPTTEPLRD
jgi:hypothetical protein